MPKTQNRRRIKDKEDGVDVKEDLVVETKGSSNRVKTSQRKRKKKKGHEDIVIDIPDSPTELKSQPWDNLDVMVFEEESSMEVEEEVSVLELLPESVVNRIFDSLSNEELSKLGSTNKHFLKLAWRPELWVHRIENLTQMSLERRNDCLSSMALTRDDCRLAVVTALRLNNTERHRLQVNLRMAQIDMKHQKRRDCFISALIILFLNRSNDYLGFLSFFLGIFLVIFKLDERIVFSWRLVLLPFIIPLLQFNIILLYYDFLRYFYDDVGKPGRKTGVWRFLLVRRRIFRFTTYTLVACLNLSYIFLMIKANETMDGIHVAAVLVPLMVICVGYIITIILGEFDTASGYDKTLIILPFFWILLQLVFLIIRIEEHVLWPWVYTLIPTWIAFCLTIIMPIFTVFALCCSCVDEGIVGRSGSSLVIGTLALWIAILTPTVAFVAMTVIQLDATEVIRSWLVTWSPLLVLLFVLLVSCGFLEIQHCCDSD